MVYCAAVIVFLLDSSGSIFDHNWSDMTRGHAEALASPAIARVIESSGPIAVGAIGFSDSTSVVLSMSVLETPEDARRAAAAIQAAPRPFNSGTKMATAISAAIGMHERVQCQTDNPVIDLVSDGEGDDPEETTEERDRAAELDIRINTLGVGRAAADWLRVRAMTPGGFYMAVESADDLVSALRRKVVLELAGP